MLLHFVLQRIISKVKELAFQNERKESNAIYPIYTARPYYSNKRKISMHI